MSRILVAYFSASGITVKVAENLTEATEAGIFAIETKTPYTGADLNRSDKNSRNNIEMSDPTSCPAIKYLSFHKIFTYVASMLTFSHLRSHSSRMDKMHFFMVS